MPTRTSQEPNRIVFLDIDGVLNSEPWFRRQGLVGSATTTGGLDHLDGDAVALVEEFCVETSATIVVSSSWRLTHDLASLRGMLFEKGLRTTHVLDVTPFIPHHRGRGEDIQRWLDAAALEDNLVIEGLVIFDDRDDMLHLAPWLVLTTFEEGLTRAHLGRAREVLAASPPRTP